MRGSRRLAGIEVSQEGIISGQRVAGDKLELARQLRRHMTPEEKVLWERLRGHRLAGLHFRRQQVIDGFVADFYCHAAALVVELDGQVHEGRADYDAERDRALGRRGLHVLRIRNDDIVGDLPAVLARIARLATERSAARLETDTLSGYPAVEDAGPRPIPPRRGNGRGSAPPTERG